MQEFKLSRSMSCVNCCLQQRNLTVSLWETIHSLASSLSSFWGYFGTALTNYSIRYSSVPALEASFGDKRRQLRALSPYIWRFHYYYFYIVYVLGSFYCARFLITSQMSLNFNCFSTNIASSFPISLVSPPLLSITILFSISEVIYFP